MPIKLRTTNRFLNMDTGDLSANNDNDIISRYALRMRTNNIIENSNIQQDTTVNQGSATDVDINQFLKIGDDILNTLRATGISINSKNSMLSDNLTILYQSLSVIFSNPDAMSALTPQVAQMILLMISKLSDAGTAILKEDNMKNYQNSQTEQIWSDGMQNIQRLTQNLAVMLQQPQELQQPVGKSLEPPPVVEESVVESKPVVGVDEPKDEQKDEQSEENTEPVDEPFINWQRETEKLAQATRDNELQEVLGKTSVEFLKKYPTDENLPIIVVKSIADILQNRKGAVVKFLAILEKILALPSLPETPKRELQHIREEHNNSQPINFMNVLGNLGNVISQIPKLILKTRVITSNSPNVAKIKDEEVKVKDEEDEKSEGFLTARSDFDENERRADTEPNSTPDPTVLQIEDKPYELDYNLTGYAFFKQFDNLSIFNANKDKFKFTANQIQFDNSIGKKPKKALKRSGNDELFNRLTQFNVNQQIGQGRGSAKKNAKKSEPVEPKMTSKDISKSIHLNVKKFHESNRSPAVNFSGSGRKTKVVHFPEKNTPQQGGIIPQRNQKVEYPIDDQLLRYLNPWLNKSK